MRPSIPSQMGSAILLQSPVMTSEASHALSDGDGVASVTECDIGAFEKGEGLSIRAFLPLVFKERRSRFQEI